jgi:hypothetical protein
MSGVAVLAIAVHGAALRAGMSAGAVAADLAGQALAGVGGSALLALVRCRVAELMVRVAGQAVVVLGAHHGRHSAGGWTGRAGRHAVASGGAFLLCGTSSPGARITDYAAILCDQADVAVVLAGGAVRVGQTVARRADARIARARVAGTRIAGTGITRPWIAWTGIAGHRIAGYRIACHRVARYRISR